MEQDEIFKSYGLINGSPIVVITMEAIEVDGIRSSSVNDDGYYSNNQAWMIEYRDEGWEFCNINDPGHNDCMGGDSWRWYPEGETEEYL